MHCGLQVLAITIIKIRSVHFSRLAYIYIKKKKELFVQPPMFGFAKQKQNNHT